MNLITLQIVIAAAVLVAGSLPFSLGAQTRPNFSTTRAAPAKPTGKSAAAATPPAPGAPAVQSKLDEIQNKAEALGVFSQPSLGHVLAEGDVIEIKVYQEDELYTRARIDSDGQIAMPLLGVIKVGDQSVEQAQKLIYQLLERDYLHFPQVSLTLVEFAKKRFSVLGEVNEPGFFLIPEGESMSVLQAIAMAGGFTPYARSGEITIKRKVNGKYETIQVDAKAMAKHKRAPTLEIQGGDTIYVNQSIF